MMNMDLNRVLSLAIFILALVGLWATHYVTADVCERKWDDCDSHAECCEGLRCVRNPQNKKEFVCL